MEYFFLLLTFLSLIMTIVFVFNSKKLINKKTGKPFSKIQIAAIGTIFTCLSLMIMIAVIPEEESETSTTKTVSNDEIEKKDTIDYSKALTYEIITVVDSSVATRDRKTLHIYSDTAINASFEERAQTGIKAAYDYLNKDKSCEVVQIAFEAFKDKNLYRKGHHYALANYAPDGKGFSGSDNEFIWQVSAYDGSVSEEQLSITKMWDLLYNAKLLENDDPSKLPDEDEISEEVANQFNVSKDKATPVLMMKKDYLNE